MPGFPLGGGNPLFGGDPEPGGAGNFNVGMFGDNPLVGMLGGIAVDALSGYTGMVPAQFLPQQNLYDQHLARQYQQQREIAQREAATADRATYVQMLRGISKMTGRPFGLQQERAARSLGTGISAAAPFIQAVIGPDNFDQLHGSRGSASVMAQFIHKAGRTMQDTITGETGMSGGTAGVLSKEIFNQYFGPTADLSSFRGLSAGRFGMAVDELQMRGMMGPSLGMFDEDTQLDVMSRDPGRVRSAFDQLKARDPARHRKIEQGLSRSYKFSSDDQLSGLSTKDRDDRVKAESGEVRAAIADIGKIDSGFVEDLKRGFDADKIVKRTKSLAGVVAGMRDIFGDMGKPNAPMREIIENLNALTQGGLATMQPAELEKSVRMTQSLAKITGMGVGNMQALMVRGAGAADAMGLERQFAVSATQGAASFGAAFGLVGLGATPHFQASTKEEMTLMDQQLRLEAAKSGMANQLAVTMRIAETGGIHGPGVALVEAIKAGRKTFLDPATGRSESIFQDEGSWRALMGRSGVREADMIAMGHQTDSNRQTTAKFGIQDLVREEQAKDIAQFVTQAHRAGIVEAVTGLKTRDGRTVRGDMAENVALKASRAVAETLQSAKDPVTGKRFDRRDDVVRNRAVAESIRTSLRAQNIDPARLSDEQLMMVAERGWGAYEEIVVNNKELAGYKHALPSLEINDEEVMKQRTKIEQQAKVEGAMRSTLAGLGQAGPLARLADTLQRPPADFGKAIAGIMGGVDPTEVMGRLQQLGTADQIAKFGITDKDRLGVLGAGFAKTIQGYKQAGAAKDPAKMAAFQADAEAIKSGGAVAKRRVADVLGAKGLSASDLDAVLQGKHADKFTDWEIESLRVLTMATNGGLLTVADREGLAIGAKVGESQVAEISRAGNLMDRAIAGGNVAEIARHGGRMAAQSAELGDVLLADPASLKALGKGGLALAEKLRDSNLQLQALADKKTGGDVGKLIASGDVDAKNLVDESRTAMAHIKMRQKSHMEPMSGDELKRAEARRDQLTMTDTEQNKNLIKRLMTDTGASVDEASLEKMLGTGKGSEVSRNALEKSLKALERIEEIAQPYSDAVRRDGTKVKAATYFRDQLRAGTLQKSAHMSDEEYAELKKLGKEAGSLLKIDDAATTVSGEGKSLKNFQEALGGLGIKTVANEVDSSKDKPGTMRLTGSVRIEGETLSFNNARLEPSGAGSTPVVA